jgi:Uma2 family endonuclease
LLESLPAMNAPLDLKLDKQAFLNWAEGREGRYELKDHRVFMMTGASRNHWCVVSVLRYLLDPSSWEVGASDLAVEIEEDVRYPDVIVEAYIVASQDEPRVWVWQRPQQWSGRPFPKVPEELHGPAHSVHVVALGVSLPLSEIYRGVGRT